MPNEFIFYIHKSTLKTIEKQQLHKIIDSYPKGPLELRSLQAASKDTPQKTIK